MYNVSWENKNERGERREKEKKQKKKSVTRKEESIGDQSKWSPPFLDPSDCPAGGWRSRTHTKRRPVCPTTNGLRRQKEKEKGAPHTQSLQTNDSEQETIRAAGSRGKPNPDKKGKKEIDDNRKGLSLFFSYSLTLDVAEKGDMDRGTLPGCRAFSPSRGSTVRHLCTERRRAGLN